MNTIIFSLNKYFINELQDFLSLYDNSFFHATTNQEIIQILENKKIDFIIIDAAFYKQFNLNKYISKNYPDTKIILTINEEIANLVQIFQEEGYHLLSQPFTNKKNKEA